jgi:hypothetical protein
VACAVASAFAGLWHIYYHLKIPIAYFMRQGPMRGSYGFYFAAVVMWPFLAFGVEAFRSMSPRRRDIVLSLATVTCGLIAWCSYDATDVSVNADITDYVEVQAIVYAAMMAVPFFFMNELEA